MALSYAIWVVPFTSNPTAHWAELSWAPSWKGSNLIKIHLGPKVAEILSGLIRAAQKANTMLRSLEVFSLSRLEALSYRTLRRLAKWAHYMDLLWFLLSASIQVAKNQHRLAFDSEESAKKLKKKLLQSRKFVWSSEDEWTIDRDHSSNRTFLLVFCLFVKKEMLIFYRCNQTEHHSPCQKSWLETSECSRQTRSDLKP